VKWNPTLTEVGSRSLAVACDVWTDFDKLWLQPGHGCQGSVIGLPIGKPKYLYFSNPAAESRTKMTIRRSEDAGATWPLSTVGKYTSHHSWINQAPECIGTLLANRLLVMTVHPEGSAYSCMTEVSDPDQLGLLHERDAPGCTGPSCQTVFNVLSLSLSEGK